MNYYTGYIGSDSEYTSASEGSNLELGYEDNPNFDYDYYGYEFENVDNESDTYILIFYSYHKDDNILCVKTCPCKINGKNYEHLLRTPNCSNR